MKTAAASSTSFVVIPGRTSSLTRSSMSLAVRHACRIFSTSLALLIGIMRLLVLDQTRDISKHRFAIAITIDPMQDRDLGIIGGERLGLSLKFGEALLQHSEVIIVPTHERSIAIGTNRALGELGALDTGREPAGATLETARNAVAHRLFRDFQPNHQVESSPQPGQDRHQALRLGQRSGKPIEHEAMSAVQTQPVFDQSNDDLVRDQIAVLDDFSGF